MNSESVLILCVTLLFIIFTGNPDIADGIISRLDSQVCQFKQTQEAEV
jgi:hypothetical protein